MLMMAVGMTYSEAFLAAYDALSRDRALIAEPGLAACWLMGADAVEWLQGQVTQDMRLLTEDRPLMACLCTPTGQLEAVLHIHLVEHRLLIVTDGDRLAALERRVEQFVIMEDVALEREPRRVVSLQGPLAQPPKDAFFVPARRTLAGGYDLLVESLPEGFPIGDEAYALARLEAGIPILGIDTTEKTLPPELGPDFEARTISYTKGCYTGQEVLMRIHSRGHTNQTWMGLRAEQPLSVGPVSHADRADAGQVTRAAQSPRLRFIAAAMLRNVIARPGETVEVGGVPATVVPLPFPDEA